jgi:MFS family permease
MIQRPSSPVMLILAMCVAETLGMATFATFPALLPTFREEWDLSNTEAGWIGGVYFAGYLLSVPVLVSLTDRVDPRRIYLVAMALSCASALGFAIAADGVASASLWRFLQGVGLAGTYMPGLKALTDALPDKAQSRAVAFYTSSFGVGSSLSFVIAGELATAFDWRWAFILSAIGPALAIVFAFWFLRPKPPAAEAMPATRLLDFRPVFANRRALAFTLGYAVHNWELFGYRTWIVAFFVFAQSQQPAGAIGLAWSATTLAALVNLIGLPASVLGNELAHRLGRRQVLIGVMAASAVAGTAFGFSGATLPFVAVVFLAFVYGWTVIGDSATLTAGVVAAADPRYRGATMAMHSMIGFVGSFLGPLAFGAVLDVGGGEQSGMAWGIAFASLSAIILVGPVLMMTLARRAEKDHDEAQKNQPR